MILNIRLINFVSPITLLLLLLSFYQSMAAFDKLSPKIKRQARLTYHISVDYKQNWYRANHYCKYYNMDLVTVENGAEYERIRAAIDSFHYGNETFWTAAINLGDPTGAFYWATTGNAMDKTKFIGGTTGSATLPASQLKSNNNCLALKRMEYLRDNCMSENYFICQSYEIVNEVGRRLIFS